MQTFLIKNMKNNNFAQILSLYLSGFYFLEISIYLFNYFFEFNNSPQIYISTILMSIIYSLVIFWIHIIIKKYPIFKEILYCLMLLIIAFGLHFFISYYSVNNNWFSDSKNIQIFSNVNFGTSIYTILLLFISILFNLNKFKGK